MSAAGQVSAEINLPGILFYDTSQQGLEQSRQRFMARLQALKLNEDVDTYAFRHADASWVQFRLKGGKAKQWAPDCDTTRLCQTLGLETHANACDLEREILLAMLLGPVSFAYPSYEELISAVRIRQNIVHAARLTALAFDTEHAERPEEFWAYAQDRGFTLLPGKPLIEALQKTTQPDRSGKLYSFSCYRATEYVILLAIAQELAVSNPALFAQLEQQWQNRAIMSGQFHDVFLREYGSMEHPLPPKFYIPGDRLWFRNPDEYSSNVEGYEGSWVFYLGSGLFTNFWKRDQPFTLTSKCVELFHWRHATYRDQAGKLQMDENVVDECVAKSLQDPTEVGRIMERMLRWRDPHNIYDEGGCIDTSRECACFVRPESLQLQLPG